jgi:hypothetical protein
LPLNISQNLTGIRLVPPPVQVLSRKAELDHKVARKILRLDFSPFLPPKPDRVSL